MYLEMDDLGEPQSNYVYDTLSDAERLPKTGPESLLKINLGLFSS